MKVVVEVQGLPADAESPKPADPDCDIATPPPSAVRRRTAAGHMSTAIGVAASQAGVKLVPALIDDDSRSACCLRVIC